MPASRLSATQGIQRRSDLETTRSADDDPTRRLLPSEVDDDRNQHDGFYRLLESELTAAFAELPETSIQGSAVCTGDPSHDTRIATKRILAAVPFHDHRWTTATGENVRHERQFRRTIYAAVGSRNLSPNALDLPEQPTTDERGTVFLQKDDDEDRWSLGIRYDSDDDALVSISTTEIVVRFLPRLLEECEGLPTASDDASGDWRTAPRVVMEEGRHTGTANASLGH